MFYFLALWCSTLCSQNSLTWCDYTCHQPFNVGPFARMADCQAVSEQAVQVSDLGTLVVVVPCWEAPKIGISGK